MTTLRISYIFVLGTLALGGMTHAGTKTKCDVVRSLKAANVGDSEKSLLQKKSQIKRGLIWD